MLVETEKEENLFPAVSVIMTEAATATVFIELPPYSNIPEFHFLKIEMEGGQLNIKLGDVENSVKIFEKDSEILYANITYNKEIELTISEVE